MSAIETVTLDAWPGAIIRNNLLYAAEQILIQKTNRSLREQIDTFPLDEIHPLYKELKEGFPKGYVLTDFSHVNPSVIIRKDEVFSFSLLLIGHFNDYRFYFFEAIREMCKRGVGKPMTPFRLLEITENPVSPVSLSDFIQSENEEKQGEIAIRFHTPVILYRLKEKKNKQLSFQDKSNRFPCLYQLTRSAFSRLQKLYALYIEPTDCSPTLFEETQTESYLEKAGQPLLQSANIQYIHLPNTLKKGMKNEMPLAGYVGEQRYIGNFGEYLPLLKFMEKLGVGNETVYGMGRYEVEKKNLRKQTDETQKIEVENEIKTLADFNCTNEADMTEANLPKMLKLPQLIIRFKNRINQREISFFVEAITKKAINYELFQKHIISSNEYCYPFIQFKRIKEQASIICIGEGTESIGGFFSSMSGPMNVGEKEIAIEIESIKAEKILIQAWESSFTYTVRKYLAMSSEKYSEYRKINETNLRHEFIVNILKSNILFFAKSAGVHIDREITCVITELEGKATVKYKNHTFAPFDLKFRTNVSLPNYIGLGIGVSHGFGMVARISEPRF